MFGSQVDPYITNATMSGEHKRDRATISGTPMSESAEQKARLEPPQPIESAARMLEARGI